MKSSKLILASVATLLCIATGAQEKGNQREKKPGREELAVRQAEHICAELALDDKTCASWNFTTTSAPFPGNSISWNVSAKN